MASPEAVFTSRLYYAHCLHDVFRMRPGMGPMPPGPFMGPGPGMMPGMGPGPRPGPGPMPGMGGPLNPPRPLFPSAAAVS